MKLPESFPAGFKFVADFSGEDFVGFTDGRWFKLADDGATLTPLPGMGAALRNAFGSLKASVL